MEDKIMELINKYSNTHPLAKESKAEYIWQNDFAQVDAVDLVCDIFELLDKEE